MDGIGKIAGGGADGIGKTPGSDSDGAAKQAEALFQSGGSLAGGGGLLRRRAMTMALQRRVKYTDSRRLRFD